MPGYQNQNQQQGGYQQQNGYQQQPQAQPNKTMLLNALADGARYALVGEMGFNTLDHWIAGDELVEANKRAMERFSNAVPKTKPYVTMTLNNASVHPGFGDDQVRYYAQTEINPGTGRATLTAKTNDKCDPAALPLVYAINRDTNQYEVITLNGWVKTGTPCTVVMRVYDSGRMGNKGRSIDRIYLGTPQDPVYTDDDILGSAGGAASAANDAFDAKVLGFGVAPATHDQIAGRQSSRANGIMDDGMGDNVGAPVASVPPTNMPPMGGAQAPVASVPPAGDPGFGGNIGNPGNPFTPPTGIPGSEMTS